MCIHKSIKGGKTDFAYIPVRLNIRRISFQYLEQGVVDGTECVADLGSKQAHYSDNNDGDECENDRILDKALALFFGCK